jgi:hypothetical protein
MGKKYDRPSFFLEFEFEYEDDYDNYRGSGDVADVTEKDDAGIEIENCFYEADDLKYKSPDQSRHLFSKVIDLCTGRSDYTSWLFKALLNLSCLNIRDGK